MTNGVLLWKIYYLCIYLLIKSCARHIVGMKNGRKCLEGWL